jgi:hypothetical protein
LKVSRALEIESVIVTSQTRHKIKVKCRIYIYLMIYICIMIYIHSLCQRVLDVWLIKQGVTGFFIIFNTNTTLIDDRPIDLSVLLVQILLSFVLSFVRHSPVFCVCLSFIYRLQNFLIKSIILFIPHKLQDSKEFCHEILGELFLYIVSTITDHSRMFAAFLPLPNFNYIYKMM